MAGKIVETLDDKGKLHLSNVLDNNTGESVTYTETSEISTDIAADGVFFRKYKGKYIKRDASRKNVKSFGAKGDGVTDDTDAIQKCLNLAGDIFVPKGVYMIDCIKKLSLSSNSNITWDKEAIFVSIPNNADSYRLIDVLNVENVTLRNPTLNGDRYSHIGTIGEHGHGLVIAGGKNIRIYDPTIKEFWGDGMAIYGGEDVYIENLKADFNRRQGLTITKGRNIWVKNPTLSNCNGTAPMSGLDIEPNFPEDYLENIVIENPVTFGNLGGGIVVGVTQLYGANKNVSIKIINPKDDGSATGIQVSPLRYNPDFKINGEITIENPILTNSKTNAIWVRNYCAQNSPLVKIINPVIVNTNSSNSGTIYGCGIAIQRTVAEAAGQTHQIGNVFISNPSIIDNRATPLMKRGIFVADDAGQPLSAITIDGIVKIEGVSEESKVSMTTGLGVKVTDPSSQLALIAPASRTIGGVLSQVSNFGATALTIYTLNQVGKVNCPINFVNQTTFGLQIKPQAGQFIRPISSIAGKYIQTKDVGAMVTLRFISETEYIIDRITGKWSIQDLPDILAQSQDGSYKKFYGTYASSNLAPSPLLGADGANFVTNKSYKVNAWRGGTAAANIMSEAIFRYNSGSWVVINTLQGGTTANDPKLFVNAGVPSIGSYADTLIGINVIVEEISSAANSAAPALIWNPNITDDNTAIFYKGVKVPSKAAALTATPATAVTKTSPAANAVYTQADVQKMVDDITNLTNQFNAFRLYVADIVTKEQAAGILS